MKSLMTGIAAGAVLLCSVASSFAQKVSATPDTTRPRVAAMALAGTGLALTGLLVGAAVVPEHQRQNCSGTCPRWGKLAGAFVGSAIGASLGVHWGNGSRGKVGPSFARAMAVEAAFMGASYLARNTGTLSDVFVGLSVPAEVVVAIHTERATMRPVPAPAPPKATY